MPFDPFEPVAVGRTGLTATRLGLGGASLGGFFRAVDDAAAVAVVAHAWEIGIRSFDVAPLYGYGAAERRMGPGLAQHPRDDVRPLDQGRPAGPDGRHDPARRRHRPTGAGWPR